MKKITFAIICILTLTACNMRKTSDPVNNIANELADSIKVQALELFSLLDASRFENLNSLAANKNLSIKTMKYFLPAKAIDNAEMIEDKCAVLGCLLTDETTERVITGKPSQWRMASVSRLAAEMNISFDRDMNETDINKTTSEFASAIHEMTLKDFEKSLESNDADKHILILTYSIMEAVLNNQAANVRKPGLNDTIDVQKDLEVAEPMLANLVSLISLLSPYYESLTYITPLSDKISAILNAENNETKKKSISDFYDFIHKMRTSMDIALNIK